MTGWLTLDEYCEKYSERRGTVTQRVADGIWERGVHYAIPDGRTAFVHEGKAREWAEASRLAAEAAAAAAR